MSQPHLQPAAAPLPTASSMETFLEENFKKILFVCIAAIIGFVLYGVVNYMNRAKAIEAGEAYASAKTVEDLDVVISKYAGSLSAGNALLQKADLLWEQNKKTTSVDILKEFADKYKTHPLLSQALLALGGKQESTGNRSDAKLAFDRIVTEFPTSDVAALAQVRLGDLLWADGKEEEAKKIYDGLAAKFPGVANAILDQGQNRLQWIAAKLPTKEVDGPPKPKVDPAAATPSIPGMPNFKVNSPAGLSPTISSPTTGNSPTISVGPNGATSGPITISPGSATSAPVVVPASGMPAPAAPATPAPAPIKVEAPAAPSAPAAPAPVKIEIPAAPAKPAVTAPAAPAPIKIEVAPPAAAPAKPGQ
ncbi:MAG: tetratricopeptide repeat protein [Verrucomicrobia bacterium]|nr:tetratricopeptide repeat protein [Verrucomicrobiota bacterium]